MKDLVHLNTFIEVVRAGGFSAAARVMRVPRSTVSLHVKTLEEAVGVRLLKRSTRAIALTEEGRFLFDHASGSSFAELVLRAPPGVDQILSTLASRAER